MVATLPDAVASPARRRARIPVPGGPAAFALLFTVLAPVVLYGSDKAYGQEPPKCSAGSVLVETAREHIPGAAWLAERLEAPPPPLHLVAAEHAPDVALSALARANRLNGPLDALPRSRSGALCLVVPTGSAPAAKPATKPTAARTPLRVPVPAAAAVLSPAQVAQVAADAGFSGPGLRRAVAVALAESSGRTRVTNRRGNTAGTDQGVWQINDHYHPEVTTGCALAPSCAAREVYRITRGGTDWHQWATANHGADRRFAAVAARAAGEVE